MRQVCIRDVKDNYEQIRVRHSCPINRIPEGYCFLSTHTVFKRLFRACSGMTDHLAVCPEPLASK